MPAPDCVADGFLSVGRPGSVGPPQGESKAHADPALPPLKQPEVFFLRSELMGGLGIEVDPIDR